MRSRWWVDKTRLLLMCTKGEQSFNMVTQRDSQASVRISEATLSESSAMKTVAMLTLAFLPATFVAVSQW
jgi:hypothetical protein